MRRAANNIIPERRKISLVEVQKLLNNAPTTLDRATLIERVRLAEEHIIELTNRIIFIQEDEARRISRELHDETGHSLLALKLYLETIYKELPASLIILRKKTKDALALVKSILEEVRNLMINLRPARLDELGLVAALRVYAKTIYPIFRIKVIFKITPNFPRLPRNMEIVIYRIVQEALSNAARHSNANKVKVTLQYEQEFINLNIKDEGIGFNLDQILEKKNNRSFGLFGIQERVSLLRGTVSIKTQCNKGTEINIQLPIINL